MAHRSRDVSAGVFHVYAHCVWAAPALYRDDLDRLEFLRRLAEVTAKSEWRCIGFCLMRTHYHLVVEVADGALPLAMQTLNHGYACTLQPSAWTARPCPVQAVRLAAARGHRRAPGRVRIRDEQPGRGRSLLSRESVELEQLRWNDRPHRAEHVRRRRSRGGLLSARARSTGRAPPCRREVLIPS